MCLVFRFGCTKQHTRYENPFVTATSREILADISSLTRQLSEFDIPKPIAILHALFRLDRSDKLCEPWFRALEVWTEVDEVLENDSFDGHRRTIVEHTLNILFLPGIHTETIKQHPPGLALTDDFEQYSQVSVISSSSGFPHATEPTLSLGAVELPSPLHFQLHILTRLILNEQGRIIHHRDFWDVKDLVGLVPGVKLTQWISTRLAGYSLAAIGRIGAWLFGARISAEDVGSETGRKNAESGRRTRSNSELTQAAAYARHVRTHTHGSFSSSRG